MIQCSGTNLFDVVAVLDPLSELAQRVAPLLYMLHEELGASVRVYMLPQSEVTEAPLKSFYRFVSPAVGQGAGAASFATIPTATFLSLPEQIVLTMKVWLHVMCE